jgi:hypothetical protein
MPGRDRQRDVLERHEVTELLVDAPDLDAHLFFLPSVGRRMLTITMQITEAQASRNAVEYAVDCAKF